MVRGLKATITPFLPNRLPHEPSASTSTSSNGSLQAPMLPSGSDRVPEISDGHDALLTLRLSSSSFLDATVVDEWTQRPLFVIETIGRDSTVLRADTNHGAVKVAKIHWPRRAPSVENMSGIRIAMTGQRWKEAEDFLKFGSLFTSRKFNVPGYSNNLKWRRTGTGYSCSTASIKRPVAVLDRTAPDAPPRLRIYETVLKQDASQAVYAEVPVVLLDLLLVTALLLVSDAEEWKKMPNANAASGSSSARSSALTTPASVALWRNMILAEPSSARGGLSERPTSPTTSAGGSSGNRSSAGTTDFPDTPASAPERPFPFPSGAAPPVPPLPDWVASARAVPLSATPSSASSSGRRQLPAPPGAAGPRPEQPWLRPAASFTSSSGSGRSAPGLPSHFRAMNIGGPSSEDIASSTSYVCRASYEHDNMRSSPPSSQHPYAFAGYASRAASPLPGHAPPRGVPAQRAPPAGGLPLPPKLAPEKQRYDPAAPARSSRQSANPDAVAALGVRMREAALLGDLPVGRESMFDMPPPAYDAIFASPTVSSFALPTATSIPSPLNSPGAPGASPSPTPRQDQFSFGFSNYEYGPGPSGR